jgi:LacI family transcriptional regulator
MKSASGQGKPSVTLIDVAEYLGIHNSTVSRALNHEQAHKVSPKTRRRIMDAADFLGYRPNEIARSLRVGRSGVVGIVVANLGDPSIATFVRGVDDVVAKDGRFPLVMETQDDPDRLDSVLGRLKEQRVGGVIILAADLRNPSVLEKTAELPTVFAIRSYPGSPSISVISDDALGSQLAADHLLDLDHKIIGQLKGPTHIQPFVVRNRSFKKALARRGIKPVAVPSAKSNSVSEGTRVMTELLSLPTPPTAVFAHSDLLAIGALTALREAGLRCPEDVSIIGYHDALFNDHMQPRLTTVRIPFYEIGKVAGQSLSQIMDGTPEAEKPRTLKLKPMLMVRESTAPPPLPVR